MSWLAQGAKTLGLVLFYYCFSIGLTFYNKRVLTDYPFPLSITLLHLIVKFLLAWLVRKILSVIRRKPSLLIPWRPYVRQISIVGVLSSLDIGLSNWSLVYITVSLYTMSKSTALIFILLFAILLRLEKPRILQAGVVVLIVSGLILFTYESTSFEVEGFILVLMASVVTGLRWTTAQLALQDKELGLSNPVDVVFQLQPVMMLTLIPLAFIFDGVHMGTSRQIFLADSLHHFMFTVIYLTGGAMLAFMLGYSEYLLVYHTSSLTLSICGVVKEIIILTISTMFIEEEGLQAVNVVGMVVCIMGVTLHTLMKALRARGRARLSRHARYAKQQIMDH